MTYFISRLSVAQAATIINAIITFIQFTISLSLVVLLVYFMPKANSAVSWSSISRTLHSSVWPTILRTDSSSNRTSGGTVSTLSRLASITTILVAVAGIILPLGLSEGPDISSNYRQVQARYVPDTSPLALTTTPNRSSFVYGRQCGSFGKAVCPGNGDNPDITAIAPSILERFNSTPHSPFIMQFRKFFDGDETLNCSVGIRGTSETLVLRNGTFAVEGLIVDMSPERPGIGFWNQAVPADKNGGAWSQDILWLEPVTKCLDTNLTIDYFMMKGPDLSIDTFNITDLGGFVNLTHELPPLNLDGQHIDLIQHAYKGGALSNRFAMLALNATRESSSMGASYPLDTGLRMDLGKMKPLPLSYLNATAGRVTDTDCRGFGRTDIANATNVHVNCGIFLGPPLRTDNGDARIFNRGSKWRQGLHSCSSATRASIQKVTFRTNSTTDLQNLQISREPSNITVLWAVEKANLNISDVDLFWGPVDDQYENDPLLWTIRSDGFYVPAGSASIFPALAPGNPSPAHAYAWSIVYESGLSDSSHLDYSGQFDYAMKTKFQDLVQQNPAAGHAQIRNLIWTDVMTNNLIGTQTNSSLLVAPVQKTIAYDFRYAIPGLLLLAIWVPSFLGATLLLLTRLLTFERMRTVFNHTSVGRVVVGTSALRVQGRGGQLVGMPEPSLHYPNSSNASFVDLSGDRSPRGHRRIKSDWADTTGNTRVLLDLDGKGSHEEDSIKLMSNRL